MREVSVRVSKRALQDIFDLDLWWRRHHPSKPDRFDEELTATIALLRQFPESAPRALTKSYKNARVRVLVETGHLVVYRYADRTVGILRIFASKASPQRP
jgi:plasmid stabilization system protein ParE